MQKMGLRGRRWEPRDSWHQEGEYPDVNTADSVRELYTFIATGTKMQNYTANLSGTDSSKESFVLNSLF
jgi:hypothetical protein